MPKLTAASALAYKPREARYEISDVTPGLRLVVHPSGRRTWVYRFRKVDGTSAKLTLGSLDYASVESTSEPVLGGPLSLAAARDLASKAARQRAAGGDPAAERQAAKKATSTSADNSFGKAVEAYLEHSRKHNRCWKDTSSALRGLAAMWASRPLDSITAQDLFEQVEKARDGIVGRALWCKGPSEARQRQLFGVLSSLFRWAIQRRLLTQSPMAGLQRPRPAQARERVLSDSEIAAFWRACETLSPWHCACLRLLLLTGARLREISELRWTEIVDGSIVLSAERTKNKRPHVIQLSSLAKEVLAGVPRVEGCPYVFSFGRVPIGGWTQIKERLERVVSIPPWRIHDLRRTAASTLARLGVPMHVTEKTLNHTSGSFAGITGVYQRYSFQTEMAEALEKLSAFVRQLVS
jgi:integrase